MIYSNMFDYLIKFPEQCKDSIEIADTFWDGFIEKGGQDSLVVVCGGLDGRVFREENKVQREIHNVVACGIGGSGIGGDLLNDYLSKEMTIPFFVNHGDKLPSWIDRKSLVFITSYSGNTQETLNNYYDARKRNAWIFAITSGGKLEEQCLKDSVSCIKVPKGFPPRTSLGFLFFPLLKGLEKLRLIDEREGQQEEVISVLEKIVSDITPEILGEDNLARKIACSIGNKIPIIYGASCLNVCINRWKNQFNENAKAFVLANLFPELNHNEIEAWGQKKELLEKVHLILLRDTRENEDLRKWIEIFKIIIERRGIKFNEIRAQGNTLLARLFSLILVGDFVSMYLAERREVDPSVTPLINFLKKNL
ncbi:bifunctional phosphoglucose/phosphomannose isomerase [bacterium]|nr:bifunctional phosphoglucose/phosphomannose isomerase [bacterium]